MPIKLLCIGECMIELRKHSANSFAMSFGGDTANTAIYASRLSDRLKIKTHYMTALGDDINSQQLGEFLEQEGIHLNGVRIIKGGKAGLYLIQTHENGERSFQYYRSDSAAKKMFKGNVGKRLLASICEHEWIYLSGISLAILDQPGRENLLSTLKTARNSGSTIIFDGNYRPSLWENEDAAMLAYASVLEQCHIALVTFDDEQLLFDDADWHQTVNRLRSFGITEGVVKLGCEGCVSFNSTQETHVVPNKVIDNPVDTTAAGDSFNAAYLTARINHQSPFEAANAGNKLAAQVIQFSGAIKPRENRETQT